MRGARERERERHTVRVGYASGCEDERHQLHFEYLVWGRLVPFLSLTCPYVVCLSVWDYRRVYGVLYIHPILRPGERKTVSE